ncbi:sulfate reduction electron transfer complex DsrMKJOP subunit DsrP [Thermodesulfobacterium sp.]|jgi:molybdopterin-containing oxidoreductase family membrane subunit|uniref:sulfate reduction electron transfer complex DsrMKJOP subunit DsrP n=1 Tax=Thermodesulfobacterium sp. TaxID=1965289 RepID=UPI00257D6F0E|nr:NrfD/PsrC family molybdoenzyme membrane anchor subunit [Thermodesulfobacterium sp.]MBZ4682064.1 menaquinol oxidoreductase [Thermodesulfobacterium sp.]
MIEKALTGSKKYWLWLAFLGTLIFIGFLCYLLQWKIGLGITGMSRDVSWGFYIANFTFLVGVAASAVMVVLPYYWHNYKEFGKITVLGEFLAISAVLMCMLFIFVDLGQPNRVLNVLRYPTPNSVFFFDACVLSGYLLLNLLCGWTVLHAEYKGTKYPSWLKPFIYLAIIWAPSIHIVTAFIYQGLPGRHFWLTAIMAPRFLASAFSAGPALIIILALLLKRVANFDAGQKAIQTLAKIVTYAFVLNLLFFFFEVFTAFYSGIHSHQAPIKYLFTGLKGHAEWVPFMWASYILAFIALILLVIPATRKNETTLAVACLSVFIAAWIDKGIGLITGGYTPTPFETITPYRPTLPEIGIAIGIWALGFFVLTILYKIALGVKEAKELRVKYQGVLIKK